MWYFYFFHKCSCTNKDFFTEKCDLLNFGGTFVHTFFVLPLCVLFCFLKCNIEKALQSQMLLQHINMRKKNIYRTFDVVDKADYDMYYN